MEWEFSPAEVVKGDADYGFEDFRRDLYEEVKSNAGTGDARELAATYDLLFDLCYWLATERDFDAFVAQYCSSPPVCEFLHSVHAAMMPNAGMLGAILQRMILAEAEQGGSREECVASVHRAIEQMTSGGLCANARVDGAAC